jgi:peptide/nickel transport system permease protein
VGEFLRSSWRLLWADKGALAGGVIILIYALAAVFGPLVVPFQQVDNPTQSYLLPSWSHPLGTDFLGNDILRELIVGTRPIMEVGVLSALITVGIGVAVGLTLGYLGGWADTVGMRVVEIFLAIPSLPLIIVVAGVLRSGSTIVLALILSLTAWAGLARAIRSQALGLREAPFVEAARAQGLSVRHIVGRELLPNVGPYVAIHFLLDITGAIYAEIGLFVLGVAPISGTNWGEMINSAISQGAMYTNRSVLYLLAPMAAIVIIQVAFVFFNRVLDQLFNPRLRVVQ